MAAAVAGIECSRPALDSPVCRPSPLPLPGSLRNDDKTDFQHAVKCHLESIEHKLDSLAKRAGGKVVGSCPRCVERISQTSDRPCRRVSEPSLLQQDRSAPASAGMPSPRCQEFQNILPSAFIPNRSQQPKALEENGESASVRKNSTGVGTQPSGDVQAEAWLRKKSREIRGGRLRNSITPIHVEENERHWVSRIEESLGMKKIWSLRQTAIKKAEQHRFWRCVHSSPSQVLISMVICANALFIGLNTDAELNAYIGRTQLALEWATMDAVFCSIFTLELLMRASAERCLFFYGVECVWNFFDTVLVLLSVVNLILNSLNDTGMSNLSVARIVRFVRFIRLVRLARAVRAVQSLRLFILSILASGVSFIWCLVIVSVIVYFFASIILSGVTEYFRNPNWDEEEGAQLAEFFGSVWRAMFTLFMSISGGISWKEPVETLACVHWAYEPAFTFFIFFMFFGVLNIVVGAFVTATGEIAKQDREFLINAELESVEAYTRKIKTFFAEADKDESGMLSWQEFECHLKNPKVSAYFASLELDVTHAHRLFRLLDVDGSGEVGLDEFLDGCMRLKGQAKSIDVNMLVYETERMSQQISLLLEAQRCQVNSALEDIHKEFSKITSQSSLSSLAE